MTIEDLIVLLLIMLLICTMGFLYKLMKDIEKLKECNISNLEVAKNHQEQIDLLRDGIIASKDAMNCFQDLLHKQTETILAFTDILEKGEENESNS